MMKISVTAGINTLIPNFSTNDVRRERGAGHDRSRRIAIHPADTEGWGANFIGIWS
jgi:hypothetical protein